MQGQGKFKARSKQGQGKFKARSRNNYQGKVKVKSRLSQGKVRARSRDGQDKIKVYLDEFPIGSYLKVKIVIGLH